MNNKYQAPFTRETLLNKMKQRKDGEVWHDFINHYSDFIDMIMNKMRVPKSIREDLYQDILLKIWKSFDKFNYDTKKGSFHNWVGTISKNTIINYYNKSNNKPTLSLGKEQIEILNSNNDDLDQLIENEWRIYLSQQAWDAVVKSCRGPEIIECYKLILKGTPPDKISQTLNMNIDSVYVYRQRFKEKMSREIRTLREYLDRPS